MDVYDTFATRNKDFASNGFIPELRMMPKLKTIVIGCVDPRVDPSEVLGTSHGEVAAIRNVGGRITPETLLQLAMLRKVTQAAGGDLGPGWELIVLHHTDCGITRLEGETDMLSSYFDVNEGELSGLAVSDPMASVALDVAALRADSRFPGVRVSGLVYDVSTGLVDTVVTP